MMLLYWNIFFAHYYSALEKLSVVVAIIILISSLDDLFIDVWYWSREIWRKLTVKRRQNYTPLTAEQLGSVEWLPADITLIPKIARLL